MSQFWTNSYRWLLTKGSYSDLINNEGWGVLKVSSTLGGRYKEKGWESLIYYYNKMIANSALVFHL